MSVRRALVVLLLAGLTLGSTATAGPAAEHDLESARAAQAEAARRYRESLEVLLPLHESAVQRAIADAERRRALLAEGPRGTRAHGLPARAEDPLPGLPDGPARRGHRRPRARGRAERAAVLGEYNHRALTRATEGPGEAE